ncbi:hypothetical protein MJM28_29240, partial [Salmonella enterica subsp. enterica serovar Montevideo]|nr:hypothetical protein [Salmonella enterica subsp. enterica serovar Montevideo]
ELAEQGITNVVVLEARHLGYGGTGRNGGQVMAGIGHDIEAVKTQRSLCLESYDRIEQTLKHCINAKMLPENLLTRRAAILMRSF